MSFIEAESALDSAMNGGKVKRKSNNTKKLRAKASRVAKGAPEVVAKITNFGKGAGHVKAHLDYISRNGKVELETDRGEILEGKAEVQEFFKTWGEDFNDSRRRKDQRDTMHMVLSMPAETPPEAVRAGAREFAHKAFKNHEYVFALHTDEDHPHVHLTVKMKGMDGRRLNPRKADLQDWRDAFAQEMRDQGIDAEATHRTVRGVTRKPERSVIRHIERGDEHRPPRTSKVQAAKAKEIAEELSAEMRGQAVKTKPWEAAIKKTQNATRDAWRAAAEAWDKASRNPENQEKPNERPNYDTIDAGRARAGQRAAAVYQSNLGRLGLKPAAVAIARMRDVSRLDVVQNQRPAQVLLLADASSGVRRHGAADLALRRARTGLDRAAGGGGGAGPGVGADRAAVPTPSATPENGLAGRIRAFVAAMPGIDTERHTMKRELVDQFSAAAGRDRGANGIEPVKAPEQDKGSGPDRS